MVSYSDNDDLPGPRPARNPGAVGRAGKNDLLLGTASLVALTVFLFLYRRTLFDPYWIPIHDTLTQFTEFLYAYASFRHAEIPLWNSYLYGGQPFYLLLNHGLLLNPFVWIWFAVGALTQLPPKQVFVACHLTEVVFFAAGGFLLVKQLTRRSFAGAVAFIILLFSGESLYWTTQIYRLSIIEYVPWILFLAIRYLQRQTAGRAVLFAAILSISMNVYYPAYLAAFIITLVAMLVLLYPRLFRCVQYRVMLRHGLLLVPLMAVMILPTYRIYREITGDYYQITRYAGPEQKTLLRPKVVYDAQQVVASIKNLAADTFISPSTVYGDGAPVVGIIGLSFALYELLAFSRRGIFWTLTAGSMALNAMGRLTPFYSLMSYLSPYYSVIRVTVFFGCFVTLSLAILASMGASRFIVRVRRFRHWRGSMRRWQHPAAAVLILVLLILFVPAEQRILPACAAVILAGMVMTGGFRGQGGVPRSLIVQGLVLAVLLTTSAAYLRRVRERSFYNLQSKMFTYTAAFNFAQERPATYLRAQPLGPEFGGECCIDYYHLAERIDGPSSFGPWGSPHTQFVSRDYYQHSAITGFNRLMRKKFRWFDHYAVKNNIRDYSELLDQGVLILGSDEQVQRKERRRDSFPANSRVKRTDEQDNDVIPLYKSANKIVLGTSRDSAGFLLYTDNYHGGFIAFIDGRIAPVFKAMGILKSVEVPEGQHTIEFVFRPRFFGTLVGYLMLSVAALLWVVVWGSVALFSRAKNN